MTENTSRLSAALADRYQIERRLGEGGMATVYLAEDIKHKRKVAVKVLRPELAAVLGGERFVQEITTTANLQHPHILPLFDSGTADSFLYYVMPFIDGETLRDKLDRETQLGVEEAVRITREVADALDYAHRNGIIHRDIKPENILLHDGRPMVADFGIALAVSAAAGGRMTETGLSLGTPHYMSPEQATAEKELTNRSDIYSLGSVLYEMLTGDPPHTGSSAQQIIMKIVTDTPRLITELRRSVPPNVAAATAKSLEKLAADRFENAKDFARALSDDTFTFGTTGLAGATVFPARRSNAPAVVGLTIAALASVVAAWGWLRDTSPVSRTDAWTWTLDVPDSIELSGANTFAAISPDGSMIVLQAPNPNPPGPGLWVRYAGEEEFVPLPGTGGGDAPAVSPDGSRVAFLNAGGVQVVPVAGGSPTRIAATDLSSLMAWDGDEYLIFAASSGLFRVPVAGGEPERLTTARGEYHVSPALLPDGKGMVYTTLPTAFAGDGRDQEVVAVGPEWNGPTELVPGFRAKYVDPGYLLVLDAEGVIKAYPFDVDRRVITGSATTIVSGLSSELFSYLGWFSVSETGRLVYVAGDDPAQEVVALDGRGRVVESDLGRVEDYAPMVVTSADGRKLAFGSVAQGRMTIRDLRTQSIVSLDLGTGVTDVGFIPGGDSLVFAAVTEGIFRTAARPGARRENLTGMPDGVSFVFWSGLSGNGSTVYYGVYTRNSWMVRAISTTPGGEDDRLVLGDEGFSMFDPNPSPDGRWLAYVSTESGRGEIVVRSTDEARSEFWSVSTGGGISPRWAADGSRLYYLASDSLMSVTVGAGTQWSGGAPRALFSIAGFSEREVRGFNPYAVGADGKFYMFRESLTDSSTVRIVMIDDWRAALP